MSHTDYMDEDDNWLSQYEIWQAEDDYERSLDWGDDVTYG